MNTSATAAEARNGLFYTSAIAEEARDGLLKAISYVECQPKLCHLVPPLQDILVAIDRCCDIIHDDTPTITMVAFYPDSSLCDHSYCKDLGLPVYIECYSVPDDPPEVAVTHDTDQHGLGHKQPLLNGQLVPRQIFLAESNDIDLEDTCDAFEHVEIKPEILVTQKSDQNVSLLMKAPCPIGMVKSEIEPELDNEIVDHTAKHICDICDKTFETERALKSHQTEEHVECSLCERMFEDKGLYINHIDEHIKARACCKAYHIIRHCLMQKVTQITELSEYECSKCGNKYSYPEEWSTVEDLPGKYTGRFIIWNLECNTCKQVFTSRNQFSLHEKQHDGEEVFTCQICGRLEVTIKSLDDHMLKHSGAKPHSCQKCGKSFRIANALQKHTKNCAASNCSICGRYFKIKGSLDTHMEAHTTGRKHQCQLCEKSFDQQSGLRIHMRGYHRQLKKCKLCNDRFTGADMKLHLREKHGDKPFKCDTCSASFNQHQRLVSHRLYHVSLSCDICGDILKSSKSFEFHMMRHKSKTHDCKKCGKLYSSDKLLKLHERVVHMLERRQFKCSLCDRSFLCNGLLEIHMNSQHTGLKPYKCEKCGKSFPGQDRLRKHMKIHGKRNFVCEICGAAWFWNSQLLQHIRLIHEKGAKVTGPSQ